MASEATASEAGTVYYKVVKAGSGEIGSFEALLRWRHPERGLLKPADFLQTVEEIGLIGELGRRVLLEACEAAAAWPDDLAIAVNLSPQQFTSDRLVEDVREALDRAGLPAGRLELEISEATLLRDAGGTLPRLESLREVGVRIVMDDFGTGHSSLGYLRMFPFDKIKIDRSFVGGDDSRNSVAILDAVMRLADSLGVVTVAEGIETEEQLVRAQNAAYQEVQGFIFSEPVSLEDVKGLLRRIPSRGGVGKAAAPSPDRDHPAARDPDDPASRDQGRGVTGGQDTAPPWTGAPDGAAAASWRSARR